MKQYQEQLEQLKKELNELSQKLKDSETKEGEWKQLQELTKKLTDSGKQLKLLQEQEPEFKKREKLVTDYEICVLQFNHLLDSLQTSTKRLEQKETQIQQDSLKLTNYKTGIKKLEVQLAELKPSYEKRQELKNRADELNSLLQIKKLGGEIVGKQGRLKKGNTVFEETQAQVQKLNENKTKLDEQLKKEKIKLPDMAMLSNIKAWHVENDNLGKQLLDYEKQVTKYLGEENKTKKALKSLFENILFKDYPENADFQTTEQFLKEKIELIKKELKQIETEANELQVKARLQTFADNLNNETPCPLCGSLDHPQVYSAVSSKEAQQAINKHREGKEQQIEQVDKLLSRFKELNSQLNFDGKNRREWNAKKVDVTNKIRVHSENFKWEKFKNRAKLEEAFRDAESIQISVKKKEIELETLTKELDKKSKEKERYQSELEKIRTEVTVAETEHKTLTAQLKIVALEFYQEKTGEEIEGERKKLLFDYEELEKQYSQQTKQLTEQQKLKDILSGSIEVNKKGLVQEKENKQQLLKGIDEQLLKLTFKT